MNRDEAIRLLTGGQVGILEWNRRRAEGEGVPNLDNVDLNDAELREANLTYLELKGANLWTAKLQVADLSYSDLSGADMHEANLFGAKLNATKLHKARLDGADLMGADFERADLQGASMINVNLIGARLRCANLSRADLRHALMYELATHVHSEGEPVEPYHLGTDFHGAKLCGANLRDAQIADVSFEQADLSDADLRGVGQVSLWRSIARWWHKKYSNRSRQFWIDPRFTTPRWLQWFPPKLQRAYWRLVYPWLRFPFKLDDTRIRGTRFSPRVSDPWSVLRRKYTGHLFTFHLL
jgi:uncharacterized protein YjbI with pentapeptide repeats